VQAPEASVTVALGDTTAYLPLSGLIDLEKERARLESELAALDEQHARVSKLLQSEFAQKAPPQVVDKERAKLAQIEAGRSELADRLASLS
ncbi:MAG: hypothetical protein ACK2T3_12455, partial [Candidatus Promineifilaceae bacterium]